MFFTLTSMEKTHRRQFQGNNLQKNSPENSPDNSTDNSQDKSPDKSPDILQDN